MLERLLPEAKLTCPYCRVAFRSIWQETNLGSDPDGFWVLRRTSCANCERFIVMLQRFEPLKPAPPGGGDQPPPKLRDERMVHPKTVARTEIPPGVPKGIVKDYGAACKVLADSPEASAALSRRCLQNLLVEKAGVTKKDLADQIEEVLTSKQLPSRLADDLHAVRVIGNFGAHPIKSKSTGEIVDVEPGEAEWNLEVVEGLLQHYYVEEERAKQRRAAMNQKLKDAGKPPLP